MFRFKILLLPFAATAELLMLGICWAVILVTNVKTAERLMRWAMTVFPNHEWYLRP